MTKDEREEIEERQKEQTLPENIAKQFKAGRLLALVTAKPGQVGKADGYILEDEELEFYLKKIRERKKK